MTARYFIYYRVDPEKVTQARSVLDHVLADVAQITGTQGRVLTRTDDQHTWMEIYEPVPDPVLFDAALSAALARHGFDHLLAHGGRRIVERFTALTES